ncbi:MAG: hypothetical protein R2715_20090 [Ilumatobacteraceae bacterium]
MRSPKEVMSRTPAWATCPVEGTAMSVVLMLEKVSSAGSKIEMTPSCRASATRPSSRTLSPVAAPPPGIRPNLVTVYGAGESPVATTTVA